MRRVADTEEVVSSLTTAPVVVTRNAGTATSEALTEYLHQQQKEAPLFSRDASSLFSENPDIASALLDHACRVRCANGAFYEMFALSRGATEGRRVFDLGGKNWSNPALGRLLEAVFVLSELQAAEIVARIDLPGKGRAQVQLRASRLFFQSGDKEKPMIYLTARPLH
jgi:hypothetical protein